MNIHISTIVLIISTITVFDSKAHGQELPLKDPRDTTSIVRSIAQDLSVSESRAKQIWSILNYNQSAIEQVTKDRDMDADERHQTIRKLLGERALHIDTSLNATEKELLRDIQTPTEIQRQNILEKINRNSPENNLKSLKGGSLKQAGERNIRRDSTKRYQ